MRPQFTINQEACIACWKCADECPQRAIARGHRPVIDDTLCIGCGHCGAVCSQGAVQSRQGRFLPWTKPSIAASDVRALLTGRRSVRRYQPRELGRDLLEEILSVGAHSPTATNARDVQATVLQGGSVRALAERTNVFYRRLGRLASNPFLRPLLWLTAARPYVKNRHKLSRFMAQIDEFERGRDWIFFHAPAVVILTAPKKHGMFGRVNAAIAAEQMLQYAFAMGVGSCVVGYAEVVLRRQKAARNLAMIGADQEPHVVFTLGYPSVTYQRLPARSPLPIRWT